MAVADDPKKSPGASRRIESTDQPTRTSALVLSALAALLAASASGILLLLIRPLLTAALLAALASGILLLLAWLLLSAALLLSAVSTLLVLLAGLLLLATLALLIILVHGSYSCGRSPA